MKILGRCVGGDRRVADLDRRVACVPCFPAPAVFGQTGRQCGQLRFRLVASRDFRGRRFCSILSGRMRLRLYAAGDPKRSAPPLKDFRTRLTGSGFLCLWLVVVFSGAGLLPARGAIDGAISKTVWKLVFGLTDAQVDDPAWMASDTDGDGLTNDEELAAGTNPLRADSGLGIKGATADSSFVYLTFPSARSKLYSIESLAALDIGAAWAPLQPPVQSIGNGIVQTLAAPRAADQFYRIATQEIDTDGDGVSDWAEVMTGLDPNNAHTKGSATDDHTTLATELPKENIVTVTTSEPATTQPPDGLTLPASNGSITISRGGTLNFATTTVALAKSGTATQDVDYTALPDTVTFSPKVGVIKIPVVPKFNAARVSNATVTLKALPGGGYTVGAPSSASVVISPAGNATGTGLTGTYYNSVAAELPPNAYNAANIFDAPSLKLTRTDATVDYNFTTTPVGNGVTTTNFAVRWTGQVQPQYSETYYFVTKTDDGVKLWVNGQLLVDKWVSQGATEWTGAIDLKAGVLYDIKMEYYFGTSGTREAHLSWYSDSQVKQIIPKARLYPTTVAAPSLTSALTAVGFVNQPFSFTATASNSANVATTFALGTNSGPLPPGLSLNANTGVISGTPTQAGEYQVAIVSTNANGTGSSVLNIQILDTGNAITRDVWTSGVTGPAVSDIPVTLTPNSSDNSLSKLEDNTAYADNTAERLRGYFTAPSTGNYYFWISASSAAELWISNDSEEANKMRRAYVTSAGTAAETWNAQPNQKSPWLSLVAGKRYYIEVLHNHGTSTPNDSLSVAWFQDPTGTTSNPVANNSGVVPGYLLSPYTPPAAAADTGALYATNMAPQGTAISTAVGSASLRVNADYTQAVLRFQYGGLSSPRTAYHIHMEDFGAQPSQIIYDIDDIDRFHPELKTPDGGYIWNIVGVGGTSAADIANIIKQGKAYINIHTVNYGPGEIRGNFGLVQGSQTAPVLQADPGYTQDSGTDAGAARFLNQATFGAGPADMSYVKTNGYAAWIDNQFALPASRLVPDVLANVNSDPTNLYPSTLMFNAWWKKSITAPDQLRQRVAFALSEIMVVSDTGPLNNNGRILADFYDTLLDNAFGNFREILKQVTLTPAMGIYLDMRGNQKGNLTTGLHPNENYAREIMQLFSLGLNRLWPDGRLVLDSNGNLIPTYDQKVIEGVARVFTGWNYGQDLQGNGRLPTNFSPSANYLDPMVLVPTKHELGTKLMLDNVVLPAAVGYSLTSAPIAGSEADPAVVAFDSYCLNDLEKALDSMFNNSSVGPFICRQLIQRLVSSNPSPAYLHRVVQKFNDDGSAQHVRGNMQAVIKAILLDGEARSTNLPAAIANVSGKQREPLLRITGPARAFPVLPTTGTYSQSGGTTMTVTTSTPHLLAAGNPVFLDFTGNTPIPVSNPTSQNYSVVSAPTATTFTVAATGLQAATYTQAVNSTTIVVGATGLPAVGAKVYLNFTSGGAPSGIYSVVSQPDSTHFSVTTTEDPATIPARNGALLIPRLTAGEAVRNVGSPPTSTVTVSSFGNHNLKVNDHVWLDFSASSGSVNTDAEFTVASIVDEDHFTIVVPSSTLTTETINTSVVYMLVPPPLTRSGTVKFEESKYDAGYTESYLLQSPLNSPTVFNFYFPDYKYPGTIAANNVTTPEFQLTTDTNVVTLTNTIAGAILSSSNTNGLTSYRNGGGTITMDLSPYMTSAQTSDAAIPALVDKLGDLLAGGNLTASSKSTISNFVKNTTNFPFTTPTPTSKQMSDRVRAIVHLIVTSPEYAIQK